MAKSTALVLAGAVAKGAFGAGALAELALHARAMPVTRIVGASSGALNSVAYATGIRAARELDVATRLTDLWQHEATWLHVLNLSPSAMLSLRGVGNANKLVPIIRNAMAEIATLPNARQPISVGLVVAVLAGRTGRIGGEAATTFEQTVDFDGPELDTEDGRERAIQAALGSAAFPGLFAPRDVPEVGPCIDGGAVNNTPIKRAFGAGKVDRVVVITSQPVVADFAADAHGPGLIGQIAEILINERLYRDLHDAESVNATLRELRKLEAQGVSAEALDKVRAVLGWTPLEVVQIRPKTALAGSPFSAFGDRELMKEYVEQGREAARAALASVDIGG